MRSSQSPRPASWLQYIPVLVSNVWAATWRCVRDRVAIFLSTLLPGLLNAAWFSQLILGEKIAVLLLLPANNGRVFHSSFSGAMGNGVNVLLQCRRVNYCELLSCLFFFSSYFWIMIVKAALKFNATVPDWRCRNGNLWLHKSLMQSRWHALQFNYFICHFYRWRRSAFSIQLL